MPHNSPTRVAPTVTVGIPAYNSERTIRETLDTLLAQSYPSAEIIVSDNHSTDSTYRIVQEEYVPRGVELVRCPVASTAESNPLGISLSGVDNFNSLLERGTGEYLAIFHSDDLYDPQIVERELRFLEDHPAAGAVFTGGRLINAKGERLALTTPRVVQEGQEATFDLAELVTAVMLHGSFLMTPTFMARRAALLHVGAMSRTKGQGADYDWWFRIARAGCIGVVGDCMFSYRLSPTQDSRRGRTIYRKSPHPLFALLDEYLALDNVRSRVTPQAFLAVEIGRAMDELRIARNFLHDGQLSEARQRILSAVGNVNPLRHGANGKALAAFGAGLGLLVGTSIGLGSIAASAEEWLLSAREQRRLGGKRA